jgi:transcriptional regulator with GAF, ATPase, and Fis domain
VDVADTLVSDYDVVDFMTTLATRCVELFDTSEAGLMLENGNGLQVAASSSRSMNHLELFELQYDEGPCVDCFRRGQTVISEDLARDLARWPRFAPEALDAGFHSVYALPMRLRETTIGSLNLLRAERGILPQEDLTSVQALADVATVGLLQHRAAGDAQRLTAQLQHALESRVVIEQAKGVLAEFATIPTDEAFDRLRQYARDRNERLSDVARALVTRSLPPADFVARRERRA